MMKRRTNVLLDIGSHVVLVISTIIAIFPLIWILLSSVKGKGELTQFPTRFWPKQFTLDYFTHVINDLHFINNIKNSLLIALTTTVIAIIISLLSKIRGDHVPVASNYLYLPSNLIGNSLFYCHCKSWINQ